MEENVLYDTNMLIDYLKSGKKILTGYTTIFNVVEYPRALYLKGLRVLYPTNEEYRKAIELSIKLRSKGTPVPAIDILIASIALNRGLKIYTKDEHFKYIKNVEEALEIVIVKKS